MWGASGVVFMLIFRFLNSLLFLHENVLHYSLIREYTWTLWKSFGYSNNQINSGGHFSIIQISNMFEERKLRMFDFSDVSKDWIFRISDFSNNNSNDASESRLPVVKKFVYCRVLCRSSDHHHLYTYCRCSKRHVILLDFSLEKHWKRVALKLRKRDEVIDMSDFTSLLCSHRYFLAKIHISLQVPRRAVIKQSCSNVYNLCWDGG